jgi:hypothetical protein
MYKIKDYRPSKPFFKMSLKELVKHNNKCVRMDLYNKNPKKRRKTRNRRNSKTKRKRTRNFLSKKFKIKIQNKL